MSTKLITPKQLCERWNVKDNTIRKWRVAGIGPAYIKLGTSANSPVRYKLDDVERMERTDEYRP